MTYLQRVNLAQNMKLFGRICGWTPTRTKTVEMTAGEILLHDIPELAEDDDPLPDDRLGRMKPTVHGVLRGIVNELTAAAATLE